MVRKKGLDRRNRRDRKAGGDAALYPACRQQQKEEGGETQQHAYCMEVDVVAQRIELV